MQLNIQKQHFYNLSGISGIKAHIEKINNLNINENKASGVIEINVSYSDLDGMECFKVIPFDFEFEINEMKIIDINLADIKLSIVEGEGINIEYNLIVNYLLNDNKTMIIESLAEDTNIEEVKEIELIEDVEINEDVLEEVILDEIKETFIEDKSAEIDKIKEDISKNYEDKLADTLNQNHIKSHNTNRSIINYISSDKRYIIKSINIKNESELNEIAKEYNVPLDKLFQGYERNNGRVIFTID